MRTVITTCILLLLMTLSFASSANDTPRCWVFLRDPVFSPEQLQDALRKAEADLTPRAAWRRSKVRSQGNLADANDIPIPQYYLDSISARGYEIVHVSKFLRAVSVRGKKSEVEPLTTLSFVRKVEPVAVSLSDPEVPANIDSQPEPQLPPSDRENLSLDWNPSDYGVAYNQLRRVNIPAAHDRGYAGQGIIVGVLDAGFARMKRNYYGFTTPYHIVFDSLDILTCYDFVNNDSLVINQPLPDSGDGSHGTKTLSTVAGFAPGSYIGAAPRASVILAKTENTVVENQLEEDHWVAGMEWADSLGADIISSSLSYRAWYPYNLRDGDHAITTVAADLAAARGLLICNSSGNQGASSVPWISCPADGDSVLTVGAVTADSIYASFASRGPTYDGRIKPDLVAQGSNVYCADAGSTNQYTTASGTSLSTPIVAGACAVVLSANPLLTPMELLDILRSTATRATNPDTFVGWGIPDINRAVDTALARASACPPEGCIPLLLPEKHTLRAYPNPFNPTVTLYFEPATFHRTIEVYDRLGRIVTILSVTPGVSTANFTPNSTTTGTYFLRFPNSPVVRATFLR
ncbi:MAG: S8 family peptidase [bacterium]|nr:S8 family peptidase [bacterium]